ncbi:hypothetical protein BKA80DRAFT_281397 [Phyllosticta citrichinensis]
MRERYNLDYTFGVNCRLKLAMLASQHLNRRCSVSVVSPTASYAEKFRGAFLARPNTNVSVVMKSSLPCFA